MEIIEIKQQAIVSSLSEVSFQFTQLRADVIASPKTFVFKFSPDEIPQYLNYLKQIQNTPLGEELELQDLAVDVADGVGKTLGQDLPGIRRDRHGEGLEVSSKVDDSDDLTIGW